MAEKDKKDTVTFIPINNKLKTLGVTKFVRQSNIIEIGFKKGQIVVFDLDPKKVVTTRENLEKAAKKCQGLSVDTVNKLGLILMDSDCEMYNYDYYKKREILLSSHLELNNYFRDVNNWDSTEIRKRSEILAKKALEICGYFGARHLERSAPIFRKGLIPKHLIFLSDKYDVSTWRDVEQKLLEAIYEYDNDIFEQIVKQYPRYIGKMNARFETSRKLHNGHWIETNLSAEKIYKFCINATETAGLSSEDW